MTRALCCLLFSGLVSGCVTLPGGQETLAGSGGGQESFADAADEPSGFCADREVPCPARVVRGAPHKILDGAGRLLGLPRQVLLWDLRIDNHHVSPETERWAMDYLSDNHVSDVLVRVNQYAPVDEWKRLRQNRKIGAGWRYTVGALDLLLYTLIPGRLRGQDCYNPFTDSIHLYSDVPAVALHEAAYAQDVHSRRNPGTYVVLQHLPLVGMWYRTNATRATLDYMREHGGTVDDIKEADHVLYPLYGGAAGGQIGNFVPVVGPLMMPIGTVVGHVVGRVQGAYEESRSAPPTAARSAEADIEAP